MHEADVPGHVVAQVGEPFPDLHVDGQDDIRAVLPDPSRETLPLAALVFKGGQPVFGRQAVLGHPEAAGELVFHGLIDVRLDAQPGPLVAQLRQMPHRLGHGDVLIVGNEMDRGRGGPVAQRHGGGAFPDRIELPCQRAAALVKADDRQPPDVARVEDLHQPGGRDARFVRPELVEPVTLFERARAATGDPGAEGGDRLEHGLIPAHAEQAQGALVGGVLLERNWASRLATRALGR